MRSTRRALASRASAVAAAVLLAGCSLWYPTTVPMRMLSDPAACGTQADTLLVMLPGSFDKPEDFVKQGFVDAVRERHLKVDLAIVDAHLGYYSEKSIIDRLQADVIAPAKAKGYAHVWLVGISIGSYGAMLFAEAHPAGIDGVVVLGPYLGARAVSNEIERAGGLRQWTPPVGPLTLEEVDLRLWRWLKPIDVNPATSDLRVMPPKVALYMGYGLSDRFRYSDDLLAAALSADRVFTTEGGHDWPTWRTLWRRLLDAMPLPRDASCASGAAIEPAGRS